MPRLVAGTCWLLTAMAIGSGPCRAEDLRVTVVAILASDQHQVIDPKLSDIAKRVQKREPTLTGFRLGRTTTKSVTIGNEEDFPLVEEAVATILIEDKPDKDGRVKLTVRPPQAGEISYSCCCDKFFPVVTRYQTKDKQRLIVGIMVKPCGAKKNKP